MDVDLREVFEQGFSHEPPHRPVAERLEAGRRAVRRRRVAGALVTVVAAGVVGLGASLLLTGGSAPDGTIVVADDGPSTPAPQDEPGHVDRGTYVTFADDGSLVSSHGVTILDQRHPVELRNFVEKPTDRTAAALLRGPDGKKWYVLVRDLYGEIDVEAVPYRTGGPDLASFLAYAEEAFAGGEGVR